MTRQGVNTVPMLIPLDRSGTEVSLQQQIYLSLRFAILEGRLNSGFRLPGSRVLANDLRVSRATILAVYDRLKAEELVIGKGGGGTHVQPRARALSTGEHGSFTQKARPHSSRSLSLLGAQMIVASNPLSPLEQELAHTPFALGVPALDAFPVSTWARLTAQRWRKTPRLMLCPDDGAGYGPLREAIASYVATARGIRCSPDQVVITSGAQQAIDLLSRLLLNPGDSVWVEEFGYQPARAAFAAVGGRAVEIPVDEEGLDVARGKALAPEARMVFLTPTCQPPFNTSMSASRRAALLDWAVEADAWIVEDDYVGELHYEGPPSAALQAFDHPGAKRVIYVRTFSKTLFPSLRLGYVVLPHELVEVFTRGRLVADRHSPIAEQAVLTDFIVGGHFARHARSMRQLYWERQTEFIALANRELGKLLTFRSAAAGIRLVGLLPAGVSDQKVAIRAKGVRVQVQPLSFESKDPQRLQGLAMGYVSFRPSQLAPAMAKLAQVIHSLRS